MEIRHFAFFRQDTGAYVREWAGPVPDPPRWRWRWLLNAWATRISRPAPGEIGLDVTQFGWPVGNLCHCRFDVVDRRLEWGQPRHYLEVQLDTLEIVANTESHRPIEAAAGRGIIDITGHALAQFHGRIYGRFVQSIDGWRLVPATVLLPAEQAAIEAARVDDVVLPTSVMESALMRRETV